MPRKASREPKSGLPEAFAAHRTTGRVRLKAPSQAGREDFFRKASEMLETMEGVEKVVANPLTGSLLLLGAGIDLVRVAERAEKEGLFKLSDAKGGSARRGEREGLAQRAMKPLRRFKITIQGREPGGSNLSAVVIFALIAAGAYQIWRGQAQLPPWHAAFWYALGLIALPALGGESLGAMGGVGGAAIEEQESSKEEGHG